jgi:hypothetical protein
MSEWDAQLMAAMGEVEGISEKSCGIITRPPYSISSK